jgi:hypothetical protein
MPVNKAFLEKIEKQIEERNKLNFFILVWGSGKSNQPAFKKRKKMAEKLSKEFKRENIIMSEDKGLQPYTRRLGDIVSESIQVDAADFIIILDTSIGPHLEAQEYFHKISHKSIVICNDRYAKEVSFASNLRYKYNLVWFKDEEFQKCKLVDPYTGENLFEHCLKKALILREKKFNQIHKFFY